MTVSTTDCLSSHISHTCTLRPDPSNILTSVSSTQNCQVSFPFGTRGSRTKQQQHSDQGHCDGERARTKEQKLGPTAGTTAVLWYPAVLPPGAFASPGLPVFPSRLPGFLISSCFVLWCCSESEDSVINMRIQHSNCLWPMYLFFVMSPSQVSLQYTLSLSLSLAPVHPCLPTLQLGREKAPHIH